MATKQELELKVVELQEKLDAGIPEGSFSQAELDAAIAQVKSGKDSEITTLKNLLQDRITEIDGLEIQLTAVQANLNVLKVQRDLAVLEVNTRNVVTESNQVVLNNVKYDIMYKDTMLEVVDLWRKRHIDDTAIVLVVQPI